MKKKQQLSTLLLVLILFSSFSMSQLKAQEEFAPIGAKWWYEVSSIFCLPIPCTGYALFESTGDTIVNGLDCRKIEYTEGTFNSDLYNLHIINQQGEKVFYYYAYLDSFILAYDFGLIPNDNYTSHVLHHPLDTTFCGQGIFDELYTSSILNQSIIEINGLMLNSQSLETTYSYSPFPVEHDIIKPIGSKHQLIFQSTCGLDQPFHEKIRCYEDSSIGHYNFGTVDCDEVTFNTGIDDSILSEHISISPNPAISNVSISVPPEIQLSSVELFNFAGQFIVREKWNGAVNFELDVSHIENGMYFLIVTDKQQNRGIKKLIIAR